MLQKTDTQLSSVRAQLVLNNIDTMLSSRMTPRNPGRSSCCLQTHYTVRHPQTATAIHLVATPLDPARCKDGVSIGADSSCLW